MIRVDIVDHTHQGCIVGSLNLIPSPDLPKPIIKDSMA